MNSNRSHPSYSDDFEQDIESPQNSPRSEEKVEIKVFKSSVGALTVQPKKVLKGGPMVKGSQIPKKKSSTRTLSEMSVLSKNPRTPESGRSGKCEAGTSTQQLVKARKGKSFSPVKQDDSKTSILPVIQTKALAHEKIDPQDVAASLAPSVSSLSLTRLNMQRNLSGGTVSTIRRVLAHTAIREKSYPSAKYKTYTPGVRTGGGQRNINRVPNFQGNIAKANYVAQRVASAKRMTIMDLKSKIKLLEDEIEKLKKENRFLNHLHHRQDNALKRWEGKDAELPRLLNQHKDEIRSLQEQLRRAQQNSREVSEKLAIRDKKIFRLESELDKLRALVQEEHLQDRHILQEELDITRMNLAGAEKRIREYMRHVDILEKNHRHQLAAEERKLIKVNTHTYELQQVVANLKLALRNKDRMLNYIQMRSSGRNLIRAFHAERGTDDIRSYHPPIQKSRSFDFGNSRCNTPYLEDSNREKYIDYVPGKRNSLDEDIKRKRQDKERESRKTRIDNSNSNNNNNSTIPQRSQSVESKGSASSTSKRLEKSSKSRSNAPDSMCVQVETDTLKTSKSSENKITKSVSIKPILKNSGKVAADGKRNPRIKHGNDKMSESHHKSSTGERESGKKGSKGKKNSSDKKTAKVSGKQASKELIYEGTAVGFKYEGPFVKNKSRKQDSTEILYSATTDKLSEHSFIESPSSCTTSETETATSSRSEIISNIDILSARIRESCIKVAPPEEKMASSRSRTEDDAKTLTAQSTPRRDLEHGNTKDDHFHDIFNHPVAGPGGDGNPNGIPAQSPHLLTPILLNTSPGINDPLSTSSYQTGYSQPIQILSGEVQDLNSPKSHVSYLGSPRVQTYSVNLPSTAIGTQQQQPMQSQTSQYQPIQVNSTPNSPQTASYAHIGDSVLSQILNPCNNSPSPQTSPHLSQQQQQQQQPQMLQASTIQYATPTIYPQSYSTTYSLVSADPQPSVLGTFHQETQQGAQELQQQQSSLRYPMDFQYFSFATAAQDQISTQGNPASLTLLQASPVYDSPQSPSSSRSTSYAQAAYYTPVSTTTATTQQQSTFPKVGFYSSRTQNSENVVDQNATNKTNQQSSGYNPRYYANLGTWK